MSGFAARLRGDDGFRTRCFVFAFLAPSVILFTVMLIVPIFQTLYISLTKWDGIGEMTWVGVDNYVYLFTKDRSFFQVLKNTIIAPILCNVIQIPAASVLAFLVYRCKRGFGFFQSVYFVPVVLSTMIMGMMFTLFFNGEVGPLSALLRAVGVKPPLFLSDSGIVLYTVLAPAVWQYIGYFFVIILAGMQSVPEDVIESATMDGASSFTLFWRIVMPLVKDVVQICIVLNTVGALKSFDLSFIMTQGGPGVSSAFLAVYMYKQSVLSKYYGRGAAIAAVLLALALLITVLLNWIFSLSEDKEPKRD